MSDYIRKTARWNGKKYEATGKTELEAMSKLAEKLAAAKRGEDLVSGAMTVSAWYKQWIDLYKKPKGLTEKSLKMYDEKFNGYIRPAIGHMKLKDVKDVHLQRILNSQAGRSASHVKKIRMVLQEMFKRARQSRLIPYDPAELLELPTVKQGRRRSITEEERAAILAVAERHRAGLWILTLLYTGMRPGETAALTWSDVDFDHNEIHVHAAKESGNRTIKGPKTDSGVRDIPIHAALLPASWRPEESHSPRCFPRRPGRYKARAACAACGTAFGPSWICSLGPRQKTGKSWSPSLRMTLRPTVSGILFVPISSGPGCPSTTLRS